MRDVDINQKAADKCAKLYNIKSKTVNELLKDKEIDAILNLTIPQSHQPFTTGFPAFIISFILFFLTIRFLNPYECILHLGNL